MRRKTNRIDELGVLEQSIDQMASRLAALFNETDAANKQLIKSEAKYRAIVEDQTELILRYLPDGTLTFVNEAYCKHIGKTKNELIGSPFQTPLIPEEDQKMIKAKTKMTPAQIMQKVGYLIVTYGENGAKIWEQDATVTEIPAHEAPKVVDPTGCGDAFRAGLLYGLQNDYSIQQSANIGAYIAAKAVTVAGTQNHQMSEKSFQQFLKTL